MAFMTPVELFNSLPEKDKKEIAAQLRANTKSLSVCDKKGHQYKVMEKIQRWFHKDQYKMICSRCGKTKLVT